MHQLGKTRSMAQDHYSQLVYVYNQLCQSSVSALSGGGDISLPVPVLPVSIVKPAVSVPVITLPTSSWKPDQWATWPFITITGVSGKAVS